MKVITSFPEYLKTFKQLLRKEEGVVRISSFNLYAPADSQLSEILETLKQTDNRIMIGTAYRSCVEGCRHCLSSNIRRSNSLNFFVQNNNIRVYDDLHLKYISRGNRAIIGGMNLTGSSYHDMAVLVDDKNTIRKMNEYFDSIYNSFLTNKMFTVIQPTFAFGKYSGMTVEDVKQKDPSYIKWAQANVAKDILKSLGLV